MVSGLARPLIVEEVVGWRARSAREVVAHGCTGKGNDQVRFEVSFGVLAPDLQVLAPIRDANIPREKALVLADEWGIPLAVDRGFVLDRREPVGTNRRVRAAGGPVGRAAGGCVRADGVARRAAERTRRDRGRLRARPARGARRRGRRRSRSHPRARRPRRLVRVRPGRHDREPPRGHQVARAVRGCRGARRSSGAPGAGRPDPRARGRALQAEDRAALGRAGLRRPVVLAAARRARRLRRRHADARDRRGPPSLRRRARARWSGAARRTRSTTCRSRPTAAATRSTSPHAEGFVRLYGLPLKVWSAKQGGA